MSNTLNMGVLSRQEGTRNHELYFLAFQNDTLLVWLYNPSGASSNLKANRPAPGMIWIHVAATWDGSTVRLYQDGAEVGSVAYAVTFPAEQNPLVLGNNQNQTGLSQPLMGQLDEVRLYDRALSAEAIRAVMNAR
jgi:hypothetical protein